MTGQDGASRLAAAHYRHWRKVNREAVSSCSVGYFGLFLKHYSERGFQYKTNILSTRWLEGSEDFFWVFFFNISAAQIMVDSRHHQALTMGSMSVPLISPSYKWLLEKDTPEKRKHHTIIMQLKSESQFKGYAQYFAKIHSFINEYGTQRVLWV